MLKSSDDIRSDILNAKGKKRIGFLRQCLIAINVFDESYVLEERNNLKKSIAILKNRTQTSETIEQSKQFKKQLRLLNYIYVANRSVRRTKLGAGKENKDNEPSQTKAF